MRMFLILGYFAIAFAFAVWMEAMDRRYGVEPNASTSWVPTMMLAVTWPVAVPLAMASVAGGGWGRWTKFKALETAQTVL